MTELASKFINNYVTKFMHRTFQSLVLARDGPKLLTKCQPSKTSWFQIEIDEIGSVASVIKQRVRNFPHSCNIVNIDFLLNTPDYGLLPLEQWRITIDRSKRNDGNIATAEGFHDGLTILLRSIIISARQTPCQRHLVRKQNEGQFVLTFKIYEGDFKPFFGDNVKFIDLGSVKTNFCHINASVVYRKDFDYDPDISDYYIIMERNISTNNKKLSRDVSEICIIEDVIVHIDNTGKSFVDESLCVTSNVFPVLEKSETSELISYGKSFSTSNEEIQKFRSRINSEISNISSEHPIFNMSISSNKTPTSEEVLKNSRKDETKEIIEKNIMRKSNISNINLPLETSIFPLPTSNEQQDIPFGILLSYSVEEVPSKTSQSIQKLFTSKKSTSFNNSSKTLHPVYEETSSTSSDNLSTSLDDSYVQIMGYSINKNILNPKYELTAFIQDLKHAPDLKFDNPPPQYIDIKTMFNLCLRDIQQLSTLSTNFDIFTKELCKKNKHQSNINSVNFY
ncbi:Autophagy-related protein 13 [Strongyloides ratti]|uniref:Autophagy-related protein 13 n=1 Tax=Strongyloides ratti TaxID=34506 RepID=A0A090L0J0_STRRB|nr:Autophagy-related protein 13 [Strongyloides ratti]CEF61014.1 Autophagy-related protein 13 [Strongyloides ratti]